MKGTFVFLLFAVGVFFLVREHDRRQGWQRWASPTYLSTADKSTVVLNLRRAGFVSLADYVYSKRQTPGLADDIKRYEKVFAGDPLVGLGWV